MFSSKFFLIIAGITLLLVGATLYFQFTEAQEYNLINTLQERLIGGSSDDADVPSIPKTATNNSETETK